MRILQSSSVINFCPTVKCFGNRWSSKHKQIPYSVKWTLVDCTFVVLIFFLEVIEISLNALGIPRYTRSIQEKKPSYKQKEQGNHDN
jgi:hypothetical protein